jgi:pimeloyl-ACP methyl ester carboxylesterase
MPPARAAQPYKAAPGPYSIEAKRYIWTDNRRRRKVPVKIFHPTEPARACPVVVFSPGIGGSREAYGFLGQHWATHGFVVVHLQHQGTDPAIWKGFEESVQMENIRRAARDPDSLFQRVMDVRFAIDQLEAMGSHEPAFAELLDLDRLGAIGHSFGALTTLGVAGQLLETAQRKVVSLRDSRVRAIVQMSALLAALKPTALAYAAVDLPCMHMTGTLDVNPAEDVAPGARRIVFDDTPAHVPSVLITFLGGDHMIYANRFAGHPIFGGTTEGMKDGLFQDRILQCTTAWWDFFLRGDAAARTWLSGAGLSDTLEGEAHFERRQLKAA